MVKKNARDRLSTLHDSVLHHILSFLPTKQVVKTCVLSKRWRHAWTSVPALEIVIWRPTDQEFVEFVAAHHTASNLRRFRLVSVGDLDGLSNLTSRLVIRGVTDNCYSLESLELQFHHEGLLQLSESSSFSRLRILRLLGVRNVLSKSFSKLLCMCPVLEELRLDGHFDVLNISHPFLRILNLTMLRFTPTKLSVICPGLEQFTIFSHRMPKNFDTNVPSLIKARFHVSSYSPGPTKGLSHILRCLSNARFLEITNFKYCSKHLLEEPEDNLPVFQNLKRLQVSTCFNDKTVRALIFLLKSTPNLNFLRIGQFSCKDVCKRGNWVPRELPHKILYNLKEIKVCDRAEKCKIVKFLSMNVAAWEGVLVHKI